MIIKSAIPVAGATLILSLALTLAMLLPGTGQAYQFEGDDLSPAADMPELLNARDATAAYNDQASAQAAGYALLTDAAGIACIAEPDAGAMGIHYVNGALVQAGTIDAARPQALVYELGPDNRLHLVALEYVVIQEGWDATHDAPPSLFGQEFMLTEAGNRYGLPAFYALHAWIWKDNPSGMFSPWNTDVTCGAPLSVPMTAQRSMATHESHH